MEFKSNPDGGYSGSPAPVGPGRGVLPPMPEGARPEIDDAHRKRLLKFLLVKTAAVRSGVKPAELLRVRNCYATENEQGFRFCLYRRDIYFTLRLEYVELKVEEGSSLVLFYHPETLRRTLAEPSNRAWLIRQGYPKDGSMADDLAELQLRATGSGIPHEVGVFIGYPLKDVAGFMRHLPSTPVHNGLWRVYGDCIESIRRMRLYGQVERLAGEALERAEDLNAFYSMAEEFSRTTQLKGVNQWTRYT